MSLDSIKEGVALDSEGQLSPGSERRETDQELLLGADSTAEPVISVVLPTLNEERGIVTCIEKIKAIIGELGLPAEIIVSDSSTDRTPELARELGAIVVEPDEKGYGNAYRYGFQQVRGRYVVMGDADTTYDFEAIPLLLEPVIEEDADMCLGSRLGGEIESGAMPPLHRYVGNPLLTRFLNAFYDAGVADAHSGFRAMTREALETLELDSEGMEFASEMIMDASARELDIAEVPITYHEREGEETLNSFRDGWRHVRFMLINAPGYLFSAPGFVATVSGVALVGLSIAGAILDSITFGLQTMIGGTLLTIVGSQLIGFGLFSSVAADPIREPQNPLNRWISRHFKLEHGVGFGLLLVGLGGASLLYFVFGRVQPAGAALPPAVWTLLFSTVVTLGVVMVFSSFFMYILQTEHSS